MKKLLLFDFDDTLCMTEELCFHAENSILADMGHPPMSRSIHQSNWGMKLEEALPGRVPDVNVAEFMERFKQMVMENIGAGDNIPATNLAALMQLKERGYRLGVLTARNKLEMTGVLSEKHSLAGLMEGFYYLENCTHHKPDPRVFDNALRDFQVKPEEVVYVGDSLGDAEAALGAGITFVGSLEAGIRSRADFEGVGARLFIHSISELLDLDF